MGNMDLEKRINRSIRFLHWLIDGYGRHGISLDMWKNSNLTAEWVEQHYNVNFNE